MEKNILLVHIPHSFHIAHKSLLDATRGCWMASAKKAPHVKMVLGIYKGVVVEVCKVNGYQTCLSDTDGNTFVRPRVIFDATEVHDSEFLNRKIPHELFSSRNPIRYVSSSDIL